MLLVVAETDLVGDDDNDGDNDDDDGEEDDEEDRMMMTRMMTTTVMMVPPLVLLAVWGFGSVGLFGQGVAYPQRPEMHNSAQPTHCSFLCVQRNPENPSPLSPDRKPLPDFDDEALHRAHRRHRRKSGHRKGSRRLQLRFKPVQDLEVIKVPL